MNIYYFDFSYNLCYLFYLTIMQKAYFQFQKITRPGKARAGVLNTPHGDIETPVFMPVGTQATVKAVTPAQLKEIGVQVLLANTYHLHLRPGADLVAEMGGLHRFMDWKGAILTDSGGFQVFSLGDLRKITDDGVTFKSHLDGSIHHFTPELAIQIQEKLGADIIMAFDECSEPNNRKNNEKAMERTHHWAERCLKARTRSDQALFGIIQGGIFPDLRQKSAEFITSLDFQGYAIGGLSVGESKAQMLQILDLIDDFLPKEKPRYLMGVGTPEDLIEGVRRGIDMFDCVLPTRLARHQAAQTLRGRINLMNAEHTHNSNPIDTQCQCYTCSHFSRAYLRHLIMAKEMLAATLISIHNIFTLVELTRCLRQSIFENNFEEYTTHLLNNLRNPTNP
jgi:queuine tRNA-ribosyltransferase